MSTHGIIARSKGDGYQGVYHHWDGYPTSLGKELFKLYNGHFRRNIARMLATLIDKHPAGWSGIVGADFSKRPAWKGSMGSSKANQPICKCHGDRHDPASLIDERQGTDCEWAYVFDEHSHNMTVMEHAGFADDDFETGRDLWSVRAVVNLDGPEPNWHIIQDGDTTD